MRYSAKVIGTGLILAAVTACGPGNLPAGQPQRGDVTPSTSTPAPPGSSTTLPAAPPQVVATDSVAVPAAQVDVSQLPPGYPNEVTTSNGGTILHIKAQEGGCGHVTASPAEQTDQRVVINLAELQAQTQKVCTMDIRTPIVSTPLSAPLGHRTVVLKIEPRRR